MKKSEDFRYAKWMRRCESLLHVLLGLTLLFGLNYLAMQEYYRWDISKYNKYSLSGETRAYVSQIRKPVHIIVVNSLSEDEKQTDMFEDISLLLREYEVASRENGKTMIQVEFIDINKQNKRFNEVKKKFNISDAAFSITVASEPDVGKVAKTREIIPANLYRKNVNGTESFSGEGIFTEAILDVTSEKQDVVYFTQGQGEMNLNAPVQSGLSSLKQFLEKRNIRVMPLNLSKEVAVPEDANIVIIAGANGGFSAADMQKLRTYVSKNHGKLMAFLKPGVKYGLDPLWEDWGILVRDYLVCDDDPASINAQGNMVVGGFGQHPITNTFLLNNWSVTFGPSRPVQIDRGIILDQGIKVTQLLFSSPTSWAEKNYLIPPYRYDSDADYNGPVSLAVASQKFSTTNIPIPGGQVIVFGNADFISNAEFEGGNVILFYNALNVCLDRERMLSIPPKQGNSYLLVATQDQLKHIFLMMFILPGILAAVGLMVYLKRKH